MNILICDDIPAEASMLSGLILELKSDAKLKVFHKGADTLECFHSGAHIDVCFLDILMPEMTGIALAERLREDGFEGRIVFQTTTNDFASEAFGVEAFFYMLKPPTMESVEKILQKLETAHKETDSGVIMIKTASSLAPVAFRDISHAEVIDHTVYLRLMSGDELEVNIVFNEIAGQLLLERRFVQCHRSYIINLDAVISVDGRDAIMRCGAKVPISRNYYTDVERRFVVQKSRGARE